MRDKLRNRSPPYRYGSTLDHREDIEKFTVAMENR